MIRLDLPTPKSTRRYQATALLLFIIPGPTDMIIIGEMVLFPEKLRSTIFVPLQEQVIF
jgi:hypothetical protein